MAFALSLRQPWAELILQGKKTIETRRWDTDFRGEFFIHASKTIDKEACNEFGIDPSSLAVGAIVGKATIVDVKEYYTKDQFMKDNSKHLAGFYGFMRPMFGFILEDIERIKPIPQKGALKFFEVNL
ncbi:MAG: ASCH domain-containing protein [Candidatus Schekmanbacteria bacterium]|nr:MAG: ASCH domain-containing protein [Candidatus Schekmanbacteria bacterium]